MATAGGLLSTAWRGVKWTAMRPFKSSTYVACGLTAATVMALSFAAPATALAATAQAVTPSAAGALSLTTEIVGQAIAGAQAIGAGTAKAYSLMPWEEVGAAMSGGLS